jgi:hypothetical protein
MSANPSVTLPGVVEKLIPSVSAEEPKQIARANFRPASATTVGEFGCPFCGKNDPAVFMGKVDFSARMGSDDLLEQASVSLAALICEKSHMFFVLEADVSGMFKPSTA